MNMTNKLRQVFTGELETRVLENLSIEAAESAEDTLNELLNCYDVKEIDLHDVLHHIVNGSIIGVINDADDLLQENVHYQSLLGIKEIDCSEFEIECELLTCEGTFSGGATYKVNITLPTTTAIVLLSLNLINELHVEICENNIYTAEVYVNGELAEKFPAYKG